MLDNLDVQKQYKPQFGSTTGSFGMNVTPQNPIPAMQAQIDAAAINQAASDTYIGQRLTSFSDIDPLVQYGVTIPTWIALNQASELYLRACKGDYNKSVIYKLGNFGDRVSNFLFKNPVGQAVNKVANGGKNFFKNTIYKHSGLVRAFDTTPSRPDLEMVKTQVGGIKTMLAHDSGANLMDEMLKPLKSAKDFDSLAISKAEIQRIEQAAAKLANPADRALYLQAEQLRIVERGITPQQLQAFKNMPEAQRIARLQEAMIKYTGYKDMAEFNLIKKAPEKHIDRLLEIFSKPQNKNRFIRVDYSNKNFGTALKGELIGRKVYFSQLFNKLYGATGGGHSTVLGRTLAKWSNSIMEGATSRASGGKIAALMQAYFLAEAIIRANRQETGIDKARSFAERFAELIGFFVFIPPSLQLMHKVGGLQYSGMTPQQVEAYRRAVIEFNEHVMNCDWTKEIYKQKRAELRAMYRPHTKNPFTYLGRKIGDIVTVGLEQVRPYTKHKVQKVDLNITKIMENPLQYFKNIPKRLADVFRNPKYWAKQVAGYPMRFGIPMLLLIPFFNKILVKGVNGIFGKPKEGLLDEGKMEESQANSQAQPAPVQQPISQQNVYAVPPSAKNNSAQISHTGKVENKSNNSEQEKKVSSQPDIPENRYIPSSAPVKLKDNSSADKAIENALKRAAKAEKVAYDYLSN